MERRGEGGAEDRDKYREQSKRKKKKNGETLHNIEGPEKNYVNPSAMLEGQVWTVWQQLSAGRLLGDSKESGLKT